MHSVRLVVLYYAYNTIASNKTLQVFQIGFARHASRVLEKTVPQRPGWNMRPVWLTVLPVLLPSTEL
jgi:hypothetical protein